MIELTFASYHGSIVDGIFGLYHEAFFFVLVRYPPTIVVIKFFQQALDLSQFRYAISVNWLDGCFIAL